MYDDFSSLVLKATADNEKWADVLKALIRLCGAIKGVISLRDLKTAQFIFPDEAASNLSAPLIINIEPKFVASYFDRYADCDVWTSIEQRHYPYFPYFMSDHLGLDALKRTEFWGWLEPQGIVDCLVAEVYCSRWHWVALNLHFDASAEHRKGEILTTLATLMPAVRCGWELSERLIGLDQANMASRGYLENWPYPSMILDEDLVITSANRLALQDFPKHMSLSGKIAIGASLAMHPCPLRETLDELRNRPAVPDGPDALLSVASKCDGHILQISTISQGTDVVGKRRAHFLILARSIQSPATAAKHTPRIWETAGLTKMQSAIVKWIAEGGIVPEFATRHEITKKTAYDHLFAARQKLDGISARDIYTTHQALLKIERA